VTYNFSLDIEIDISFTVFYSVFIAQIMPYKQKTVDWFFLTGTDYIVVTFWFLSSKIEKKLVGKITPLLTKFVSFSPR
jgi:hypothetical protein